MTYTWPKYKWLMLGILLSLSACGNQDASDDFESSALPDPTPTDAPQYILHNGFQLNAEEETVVVKHAGLQLELSVLAEEDSTQEVAFESDLRGLESRTVKYPETDIAFELVRKGDSLRLTSSEEEDRYAITLPDNVSEFSYMRVLRGRTTIVDFPLVEPIELCQFSTLRQEVVESDPESALLLAVEELTACGGQVGGFLFSETEQSEVAALSEDGYLARLGTRVKSSRHGIEELAVDHSEGLNRSAAVSTSNYTIYSVIQADNAQAHLWTDHYQDQARSGQLNTESIARDGVFHILVPQKEAFDTSELEFIPMGGASSDQFEQLSGRHWEASACLHFESARYEPAGGEAPTLAIEDAIIHHNSSSFRLFGTWVYNPFHWKKERTDAAGCFTATRFGGDSRGKRQFKFRTELKNGDVAMFRYTGWDLVADLSAVGAILTEILGAISPAWSNHTYKIPDFEVITLHKNSPVFSQNLVYTSDADDAEEREFADKAALYHFYRTAVPGLKAEGIDLGGQVKVAYPALTDGLACPYNDVIYLNEIDRTLGTPAHELAHIASYHTGNRLSYASIDWLKAMLSGFSTHNCQEPIHIAFNEGMAEALAEPMVCAFFPDNKMCLGNIGNDILSDALYQNLPAAGLLKRACSDGPSDETPRSMTECYRYDDCNELLVDLLLTPAETYVLHDRETWQDDQLLLLRTWLLSANWYGAQPPEVCVDYFSGDGTIALSWSDVLKAHGRIGSQYGPVLFKNMNAVELSARIMKLVDGSGEYVERRLNWPILDDDNVESPLRRCERLIEDNTGASLEDLCQNGVHDANLGESDVDCGGPFCGGCGNGDACFADHDCNGSGFCDAGICQGTDELCQNGVQDSSTRETDIDCGGLCEPCDFGEMCESHHDCQDGFRCGFATSQASTKTCQTVETLCGNDIKDGSETDVDCGSACADINQRCGISQFCSEDADCTSGICVERVLAFLGQTIGQCSECRNNDHCRYDEHCMNNVCSEVPCFPTQVVMNHECHDFECVEDSDCIWINPEVEWTCFHHSCTDML